MKKIGLVFIAILLLTACKGTEEHVSTMESEPHQEAASETTDSDPNQETVPAATTTAEETREQSEPEVHISLANPIVVKELVLGGNINQQWLRADQVAEYMEGNELFKLYGEKGQIGEGRGGVITYGAPSDTEMIAITPETPYLLAMSSDWDAMPRVIEIQSNDSDVYREMLIEVVKENAIVAEGLQIIQNYRIDLEGDGVDEVLLAASNIDFDNFNYFQKKDTYSVIVLRKIIDGEVVNIMFSASYNVFTDEGFSGTDVNRILAVADLNGDGVLEIVVENRYYEGIVFTVYQLLNGLPTDVLVNGLGV